MLWYFALLAILKTHTFLKLLVKADLRSHHPFYIDPDIHISRKPLIFYLLFFDTPSSPQKKHQTAQKTRQQPPWLF